MLYETETCSGFCECSADVATAEVLSCHMCNCLAQCALFRLTQWGTDLPFNILTLQPVPTAEHTHTHTTQESTAIYI